MNNTVRIRTDIGGNSDKFLKFQLNHNYDFIEILSLKLRQEDLYRLFCSDYGVIVGRVIANAGFGVPNARVSIFIPINEDDKENQLILGLYPYENINDKDSKGTRYNLLPKRSTFNCHTPVGNLPNKREFLDDDVMLEIYEKYYKFTTRTNNAGDFMIFGVPTGTWKVNIDVDLSDIGIVSQKPYDFIRQGKDKKLFQNNNKFKRSNNLNDLSQIFHTETSVNVLPFWGDRDYCDVGINRLDVELSHRIEPQAFFIGSIFGDNEKNSVNKNCGPRVKLGNLCETIAGEGTIEMIRKLPNGTIETFLVEGGRVIDENGSWAFQVPMNLDYVVTDEFGNLIPTEDTTKGIPTRARVRFRVGMDINGEEGRLRRRAKFLIPNNPPNNLTPNYSFDETTPDSDFRDLYWNKIYTVKSFIPRFQSTCVGRNCGTRRKFIGIKNVDDCGDHTPFPFNRLDTDINPIYSIICVVLTIIATVIAFINQFVLLPINTVLLVINKAIFAIGKIVCSIGSLFSSSSEKEECRENRCHDLGGTCVSNTECKKCSFSAPIGYIKLECPSDSGIYYMPWAGASNCTQLTNGGGQKTWCINNGITSTSIDGYLDCQLLPIAEALNVFKFDFYNDWVNGTLFAFLFKQKTKKKGEGKNKFCDYDCDEFSNYTDNDNDGDADNKCNRNWIVDTCIDITQGDGHTILTIPILRLADSFSRKEVKDGVIKLYEDEYYYAATTHYGYPLFKTDLTLLGSIIECDPHGIPLIYPKLVNTTYNRPPDSREYETEDDNGNGAVNDIITYGLTDLLFDLNCAGVTTNSRNCYNLKKICEIGVGLDERREIATGIFQQPDTHIGNEDIEDNFIRNALAIMNSGSTDNIDLIANGYETSILTYDTKFGTNNDPSKNNFVGYGYRIFRNFVGGGIQPRLPMNNSYYYYFGIYPGKTGLDKFYRDFVSPCVPERQDDLIITFSTSPVSVVNGTDGSITINVLNGVAPYDYLIIYPDGTTSQTNNIGNTITYDNLSSGLYTIIVEDSTGLEGTISIFINQPPPITFTLDAIEVTTYGGSDGQIIVSNVSSGVGPYYVQITDPYVTPPEEISGTYFFTGLITGYYTITVTDSSSPQLSASQTIFVNQPTNMVVTVNLTDPIVCGGYNGSFLINVTGGVPPYSYTTIGLANNVYYYSILVTSIAQDFSITVNDSAGGQVTTLYTLTEPAPMVIGETITHPSCHNSSDGSIIISITNGAYPYTYEWRKNWSLYATTQNITNLEAGDYSVTITDANGCIIEKEFEVIPPDELEITSVTAIPSGIASLSVTINTIGGNSTRTFYVLSSTGDILASYGPTAALSHTFTGVSLAAHNTQVIDNRGCWDSRPLS